MRRAAVAGESLGSGGWRSRSATRSSSTTGSSAASAPHADRPSRVLRRHRRHGASTPPVRSPNTWSQPRGRCFVVNDLDPDVAVFTEPTACVIHGLDVLALKPSSVLVFGAGPTGLLLTQLLASSGAGALTVAAPTRAETRDRLQRGADDIVLVDRNSPTAAEETTRTRGTRVRRHLDATGQRLGAGQASRCSLSAEPYSSTA